MKQKNYYINKSKSITGLDIAAATSFVASTALMFKKIPYLGHALYAFEAIHMFNTLADDVELCNYEKAMNSGEGVLIVTWDVSGDRCVNASFTVYYSWNGKDDVLEK